MSRIDDTIDVNVPVSTAYNQWTQFEEFPRFMEGIDRVVQIDDATLEWTASVAGQTKQWRARIVDQVPDERIAWVAIEGARNDGIVTFRPLDGGRTRVALSMEVDPDGAVEEMGDALGVVAGRVKGDLERFKTFIEERGVETGAWRGTIPDDGTAEITGPGATGVTRAPYTPRPTPADPIPAGARRSATHERAPERPTDGAMEMPADDEQATGRGFAEGIADPSLTREERTVGAGFATGATEPRR